MIRQNDDIRIMISSRNSVFFNGEILSDVRKNIKNYIQNLEVINRKIFKVWINEDEPANSFTKTIWNRCIEEVKKADIVICLDCGEAGWIRPSDTIGICHGELQAAIDSSRSKVCMIKLNNIKSNSREKNEIKADKKYIDYVKEQEIFIDEVGNYKELSESIQKILIESIVQLVKIGVHESGRNKGNIGEALSWKRMNYEKRSKAIVRTLKDSIDIETIGFENEKGLYLEFKIKEKKINVNIILHAIPDSLSVANARERVGQPFLDDYKNYNKIENDAIGPIHIIGCHKTVTESQSRNILGFPDATILKGNFGIYVADNIQKIQMVFIEKCQDSTSTSLGVQNFLNWLKQTREFEKLIKRAESRKKIIEVISNENKNV